MVTLSNTGAERLMISAANVTGSGFTVSGLALPYSLAAGSSANLTINFSPTSSGTDTASLTITSNASDPSVAVSLSDTATTTSGTLGVTRGAISFGNVTIGRRSKCSLHGDIRSHRLRFGFGNLSFIASNSTSASETATGSGATIAHKVDLSWNASTSTSVTGYNVYRATSATGSYSRINAVLNPSMSYSDSTVQSGPTYYYATTAVDSSGVASAYSNRVQVAIPFP